MAVMDHGKYILSNTARGFAPAVVLAQYDTNGDVVADGASGENAAVTSVDILLLGFANGHRTGVTRGTADNQFTFTDTLAA